MDPELTHLLRNQIARLESIPFYKNKLENTGIKPSEIVNIDDFKRIPFTTSGELLAELKKRPSESSFYSEDVTRINLSPSGHELYPIYHTNNDIENMHRVCSRSLEAAGVQKTDICVVTFGYHIFVAGLFYQGQLEYYGAKVIPLGPGDSDRAVQLINNYQASVLISNPSFAMKLAQKGIPSVKILFVGGEPFTSVEGYPEKVRKAFGRDIIIIDSYSMASCLPIARSCRHGNGLHIMDEFVYAEVIDPETGENVPHGEKGELVLTHLNKEAAPLLRYRTGDLTLMEKTSCECGREYTLPKSVFGRTDEMLKIKGVKFWSSQIYGILKAFPELSEKYRVIVKTKGGVDIVELELEGESGEATLDRLSTQLKRETLIAFNDIRLVGKLKPGPLLLDKREQKNIV